jgi:hypothetical protein
MDAPKNVVASKRAAPKAVAATAALPQQSEVKSPALAAAALDADAHADSDAWADSAGLGDLDNVDLDTFLDS